MFKIRKSVFETNSSSVHSLSFCSKDDWQKFKSGEYYTDHDLEANFFTEEEVREKIVNDWNYRYYTGDSRMDSEDKEIRDEFYSLFGFYTIDSIGYNFETYHEYHISKSGEEIHVFGYYGHD